jgi:sugar lactone lactonase YvrE
MKKILLFLLTVFHLNVNAQIITTVSGNSTMSYSGDGGQATAASLAIPTGVAIDAFGNQYISDSNNNRVRKINSSGIISTVVGTGVSGYSGDGGQATAAQIYGPTNIAIDASNNLYVLDATGYIRKVNSAGIITSIAGIGVFGYSGDGGQATDAKLGNAAEVAFDKQGNMYIADLGNNRIRKVATTGIITTIAGSGNSAYIGDGGQATNAGIWQPSSVAADAAGNIYLADNGNNCIRKVDTFGIITTVAGNGTNSFSGDGGQATAATISGPAAICLDSFNNLYISDWGNSRIRKVNSSGIISTIVGTGIYGFSGDGGQATAAKIFAPDGLSVDVSGNLYFADNGNNRIRKVTNVSQSDISTFNITNQIKIYPNPAQNNFTVEVSTSEKQILNIVDVTGKLVLTQTIQGKTTIDVSNLNAGVYNVSITSGTGTVNKRLVIVK